MRTNEQGMSYEKEVSFLTLRGTMWGNIAFQGGSLEKATSYEKKNIPTFLHFIFSVPVVTSRNQ